MLDVAAIVRHKRSKCFFITILKEIDMFPKIFHVPSLHILKKGTGKNRNNIIDDTLRQVFLHVKKNVDAD